MQRVVGRIYGKKYSWQGHKDRNRHMCRIKRSGQARLVYVWDIIRNSPTAKRWAHGYAWPKEALSGLRGGWYLVICFVSYVFYPSRLLQTLKGILQQNFCLLRFKTSCKTNKQANQTNKQQISKCIDTFRRRSSATLFIMFPSIPQFSET